LIGAELSESDGIILKNVYVEPQQGAAFIFNNVKNLKAEGLTYPEKVKEPVEIKGKNSKNIDIKK